MRSLFGFQSPMLGIWNRKISVCLAAILVGVFLLPLFYKGVEYRRLYRDVVPAVTRKSYGSSFSHRKLLNLVEPDRMWGEKKCSKSDIEIYQGPTAPLPSGIPTYTVEIMNACISANCSISHIHLSCGWFSSARLINPRIFKRLSYNDCLVNDGKPLITGDSITFQYANTFPYRLSVSSIRC